MAQTRATTPLNFLSNSSANGLTNSLKLAAIGPAMKWMTGCRPRKKSNTISICESTWFYLGRLYGNRVLGILCRFSLEPGFCFTRTQKRRQGIARVRPLLGGIEAWRARHLPMEVNPDVPTAV
jgi:hypothetical protein